MSIFYANKLVASLVITALTVTSGLIPGVATASDVQVKSTYNVQSTQSSINTLTRLGGDDRYGTAVQIADHGWQSASTAVLAPSGDRNMVDALASSSLAKAVDGPILLADIDSVPASTLTELKKLGVTKVYLVSGTAVMSAKVESELTTAGIQSVRLGGYDRYETAVNIAKEIQKIKPFQEVVVTNAYANVDAISIAPIAAAKGIPVLLVDKDSVPKVVSDFIKSSGISKTYVIGGTAVVSNSIKDALPKAMRLGGNDRFDTNTEVLKQFENLIVGGSMFFANGSDTSLIDSLAGAPLAAKLGGAIVLSNKEAVPAGTKGFIQTDIALKNPVILGGTAVMSDSAVQILGYIQPGQSAILNGAVELNTPNDTFKDKTVNGNILVDADGVTLQNVIVNGTIFVDPGKDGSATLDGVQATRIVVLSGADRSIRMKNTKSDSLVVSSSSPGTHVVAESGTMLGSTLVQSNGTVELQSGANVGVLTAQPRLETPITVGLQGTFSNDVALSGSVKLTAEAGAVVSNVKVTNAASPDAIQLAGQFASVSITDSSPVTVVSGTVAKMVTATASSIVVKQGAVVTSLSSSAGSATLSGGGTVNGNVTTATPTSSPIPVTPPVTPPPSGGGSTSTVAVSAITVTSAGNATSVVNGGTLQMSAEVTPTNATNKTVIWKVDTLTGGTALIDTSTGYLQATGVGTVTVTATNVASGVTGTKVITIAASQTADTTAPLLSNVTTGSAAIGDDVVATSNEDGFLYLVPQVTVTTSGAIDAAGLAANGKKVAAIANISASLSTTDFTEGTYVVYAIDVAGNVSSTSAAITLNQSISVATTYTNATPGWGATKFTTIQDALNKVNDGGTVNVAAGTYSAGFTVDGKTNVTIKGAGTDTIITPLALIETATTHKYTANMKSVIFVNGSTGITIQDMTLSDGSLSPDAIVFWNASTGDIRNADIKGTSPLTGAQTGQGIAVDAGAALNATLDISNTNISGFNKNGIDVINGNGATSGATGTVTVNVSGGTITGAGTTDKIAQNGIVIWDRGGSNVGGSVSGVTFKDLYYTPASDPACAIMDYRTNTTPALTVTGCTFTNVGLERYPIQ